MKTFVVTWCRYSDYHVLAVFERQVDAEAYAKAQNLLEPDPDSDAVQVQAVDYYPAGSEPER